MSNETTKSKRGFEILEAERENFRGESRIRVEAAFFEDGKQVGNPFITVFPLDTPEKQIAGQIEKACITFFADQDRAVVQRKIDEANEQADQAVSNLRGIKGTL